MKKLFIPALLLLSIITNAQSQDKQVTVKLTVSQAQLVLQALGDRKLSESIDTYMAIRLQVLSQLNGSDSTVTKPTDPKGKKPIKKDSPAEVVPDSTDKKGTEVKTNN